MPDLHALPAQTRMVHHHRQQIGVHISEVAATAATNSNNTAAAAAAAAETAAADAAGGDAMDVEHSDERRREGVRGFSSDEVCAFERHVTMSLMSWRLIWYTTAVTWRSLAVQVRQFCHALALILTVPVYLQ